MRNRECMASALAPEVRSQFAKRLKDIRTLRGFDRARYFAETLGIEENRYTRYERAEVEPSLTLIQKICETLSVTPNELLGFSEFRPDGTFAPPPGLSDASPEEAERHRRYGAGPRPPRSASLAWRLASEMAAIRSQAKSKGSGDPLELVRETGALFRRLQAEPFAAASELAAEPALKSVDAKRRAALAELIQSYTESISEGS